MNMHNQGITFEEIMILVGIFGMVGFYLFIAEKVNLGGYKYKTRRMPKRNQYLYKEWDEKKGKYIYYKE